jgi:hypothetical protein
MQLSRSLICPLIALLATATLTLTAESDTANTQAEEFASLQEQAALARQRLSLDSAELRKIVVSLLPGGERDRATRAALEQLNDPRFTQREAASRQLRQTLFIPEQIEGLTAEATWRLTEVRRDVGARQRYLLTCILNQLRRSLEPPGDTRRLAARETVALLGPLAPLIRDRQLTQQLWHTAFTAAKAADFQPAEIVDTFGGPAGWKSPVPATRAVMAAAWAATADHAGLTERLTALPPSEPGTAECRLAAAISWTRRGHTAGPQQLVALLGDRSRAVRQEAARALELLAGRAPLIDPEFARLLAGPHAPTGLPLAQPMTLRAAADDWNQWLMSEPRPVPGADRRPLQLSGRGWLGTHTLIATGSHGLVWLFDEQGAAVWRQPRVAWNAELLPGGHLLIASLDDQSIVEINSRGEVQWEFSPIAATRAKPLANGNLLAVDYQGSRVLELAPRGRSAEIVWSLATPDPCFDAERLANGHTVYGCANLVREVAPDGALVSEWKISGRLNGIQMLPDGHLLVANYGANEVAEYDRQGRYVARLSEPQPCDVQRLRDGRTLVTSASRVVEFSPDGGEPRVITSARYGSARRDDGH